MRRSGITVLEILIAVVILSAAVGPIYYIFNFSTRANVKSTLALQAANLAVEKMEYYKFGGLTPLALSEPVIEPKNEFERLKLLLEETRDGGPRYIPYEHKEDYGTIPGFPDFKRETRIAFFPKDNVTPLPKESPFKNASATAPLDMILWQQAIRLQHRIEIAVTVTYKDRVAQKEGGGVTERSFTAFSLVTNKEM